jgi:hypothetical protein
MGVFHGGRVIIADELGFDFGFDFGYQTDRNCYNHMRALSNRTPKHTSNRFLNPKHLENVGQDR